MTGLHCDDEDVVEVLSLGPMPLANNLVDSDTTDPSDPMYPLDVVYCAENGLLQLRESVPPEAMFSDYLYLTSYSQVLVDNAHALARRLVPEWNLGADDLAMEIGSNDGYLLSEYLRLGVPVLGIDPAENVAAIANESGVQTLNAFFGTEVAEQLRADGKRASVFHANNVIAHVPDIAGVMEGIAIVLADEGTAVIETPYVRSFVERLEYDTIYHEHLFYYSLASISTLLERAGLEVVDVEQIPIHGTSLRVFAKLPGVGQPSERLLALQATERELGIAEAGYFADFGRRVNELRGSLATMLEGLVADGKTIGAYAAAAKCTIMLNSIGDAGRIPMWVADKNPHKQGKLIPGVRVPVVPPERILEDQPDYLLIHAWNFLDEILEQLAEYRARGGKFIVPLPEPHIL